MNCNCDTFSNVKNSGLAEHPHVHRKRVVPGLCFAESQELPFIEIVRVEDILRTCRICQPGISPDGVQMHLTEDDEVTVLRPECHVAERLMPRQGLRESAEVE